VKNLRFNQNIIDVKTMLFNLQTTFKFLDHLLKQNKKLNIVMFCDKYSEEVMKKLAIELDNCGIKLVTGTPKTGFLYYKENLGIDLIISTNSSQNFDIFREALSFRIPVVGLCSTSVNSHLITYPIVSNTQDPKSILLFVTLFKQFFNQLKIKK
jgi:ribosomal protein S2